MTYLIILLSIIVAFARFCSICNRFETGLNLIFVTVNTQLFETTNLRFTYSSVIYVKNIQWIFFIKTIFIEQRARNFAKVGSARPSTLLYTYGPGAIMDLPHFTIMPTGLNDWDRIWKRRGLDAIPSIHAPRLLETIQLMLDPRVSELRTTSVSGL